MLALQEHPHIHTPTIILRNIDGHTILIIPANTLYSAIHAAQKEGRKDLLHALKEKEQNCTQQNTHPRKTA